MALDPQHIGRTYGPFTYTLGVEKMREFALAVGGAHPDVGAPQVPAHMSPLLLDEAAAKAGPYGDIIAFPSFAVVFAIKPFGAAVMDPVLGVNRLMLVHGEQELEFLEVMRPGDVMTTTGRIEDIYSKAGKDFLVVTTESRNAEGKLVVRGTWTAVVRGG